VILSVGVVDLPWAHVAGIPVEETLATFGPALLLVVGAALGTVRARWRRMRPFRWRGRRSSPARPATRDGMTSRV
jgi:hypothetical protein